MDKITYLRNEHLKTIKPGYPGNKLINGRFANGEEFYAPSFLTVLKWKFGPKPQAAEKANDTFLVEVKPLPADTFSGKEDIIIWLGHATFYIRLNGVSFLTDPVLFDIPLLKRKSALPCLPEEIKNLDFLLLSHGHRDHLDERSIKTLIRQNPNLKALAPLKMHQLLKEFAPELPVEEAGWFQQFSPELTNGLEVFYLPARHWHRRGLFDVNKILWGSFLLKAGTKTIFFAGDSASGPHFSEIHELFGSPDYCLMPIGAYTPAFLMQKSHLNPREAAVAFNQLGGKNFIPMHYGTFELSDEPASEPIRTIKELATTNQLSGKLITPAVGEVILI